MPDDMKTLFEPLEPPPGGAANLRRRLQREPRRRQMRVAALAVTATVVLVGLFLAVYPRLAPSPRGPVSDVHPALVSLGLQNAPDEPAVIPPRQRHRMALLRVPLETDDVVFYYVAALPGSGSSLAGADEVQDRGPGEPTPERQAQPSE